MLERIINITPGSDYKQSSRPASRQTNAYRHLSSFSTPSNDSFMLSPATAFLASINWKLKKITSENEKLHVVFLYDDYEFSTSFFVVEISQNQKIEYDIKHLYETDLGKYNINAKVSAPIIKENIELVHVKSRLVSLNDFIKAVFNPGVSSTDNYADNYDVQKLFSHMEKPLQSDFDYLNECLLSFLEKFLSIKFNLKRENINAAGIIALKFLHIKKI